MIKSLWTLFLYLAMPLCIVTSLYLGYYAGESQSGSQIEMRFYMMAWFLFSWSFIQYLLSKCIKKAASDKTPIDQMEGN